MSGRGAAGLSAESAQSPPRHRDAPVIRIRRLNWCGLTQKCCDHIASALGSDFACLKDLDLSGNNLQGPDIHLLCAGLISPHCKLETLRLNDCSLQKCCVDLASVFSFDTSHLKQLDLSGNDLQDSEIKLLSAGLGNMDCNLEILRLSFCGITEKGCTYLASALSSNPSHLRQLDLSYNYLQDSGVKLLSLHKNDPFCKLEKLSVDYNAECYLKSKLKYYACELTLDTNTAARSLFLYESGKQVTWVRERQQYPDHPDRFESVSQVLCHQGLTQRNYWEVEWQGSWVDVAMAVRGIHHRASSHLCGFGYTEESWSLYCSEDHRRVVVYLDCPGGTLSFYSISSGTFNHLHTFNGTFTEPLYPGFGMEKDDCSVTICTVEGLQEVISQLASAKRFEEF